MENIIIAFGARSVSMRFSEYLARNGIATSMINTPRELTSSCGLSVMTNDGYLGRIKFLLSAFNDQMSFIGIFAVRKVGYRSSYIKL